MLDSPPCWSWSYLAPHQHFPPQFCPLLVGCVTVNQSESDALLNWMYWMSACSSCSGRGIGDGAAHGRMHASQWAACPWAQRSRAHADSMLTMWLHAILCADAHLFQPTFPTLLVPRAGVDGQKRDLLDRLDSAGSERIRHEAANRSIDRRSVCAAVGSGAQGCADTMQMA